jgi:hypothetical protein
MVATSLRLGTEEMLAFHQPNEVVCRVVIAEAVARRHILSQAPVLPGASAAALTAPCFDICLPVA